MTDGRTPDEPRLEPPVGRASVEAGLPVGFSASPRAAGPRLPSWVVPMIVLALVAGLGVGLAVGMLIGGGDDSGQATPTTGQSITTAGPTTTAAWEPADAYGAAVSVTGNALPVFDSDTADTAVGLAMPRIAGTDFAGNPLAVDTADGRAKLIVGLAHWCPYCNNEVPILSDWYAAGLPDGVDVIALHVYADPAKPHFPPAAWIEETAFTLPLIADDESRTLVRTLGIPAVPFWLLVSADGTVMERGTGQVEADVLDGIVEALAATVTGG
jgi:thiol-disulfide isomerase/thioredoxin